MQYSKSRLKILSNGEIEKIYGIPKFNNEERENYFFLNDIEKEKLKNFRRSSKLHFMLMLGYFKAKKMFFTFTVKEAKDDIEYILKKYFSEVSDLTNLDVTISTKIRLSHQKTILKLLNYNDCTHKIKNKLQKKALSLAPICSMPAYIFNELMAYIVNQKIVFPVYSFMQDIVGKAITNEKNRLELSIKKHTPKEIQEALNGFLKIGDDNLYEIISLKREPKDFSLKETIKEINRCNSLKNLYEFACKFLPKLKISNESIKYYASLVDYYTRYKLQRMRGQIISLYLLCFIYIRFKKTNDNLANTFIYYVNNYTNEAKAFAKEKSYQLTMESNKDLENAGHVIALFMDDTIPDDIEWSEVKKMGFSIMEKDKFPLVANYISGIKFDEDQYRWEYYQKLSQSFKRNIRQIILSINFEGSKSNTSLIKAITFLKEAFAQGKSLNQYKTKDFPAKIISKRLKPYLYEIKHTMINKRVRKIKTINADKYEFLVYLLLKKELEARNIFLKNSITFRNIEDDLVSRKKWDAEKDTLIKEFDLPILEKSADEVLSELEIELETTLKRVNDNIKEEKNKHIKITGNGDNVKWSLPYKKNEEEENHSFYEQFNQIGIADLLSFVGGHCGFMSAFKHILTRYIKKDTDNEAIVGGISAFGLNIGLIKMNEISDLDYQTLRTGANNFIRLETLRDAIDKINNKTAKLEIFKYYNVKDGVIHSGGDGQKKETTIHTINSRYSPKYFGMEKGISAYTLNINNLPANAGLIGANQHESHYVFDLLYNNTCDIRPDIHSTDTHGTNQVNFAILHAFGYQFAPRYKKLSSKVETICGFKNLNEYGDFFLKPSKRANRKSIEKEWDTFKRIWYSLAHKDTTQSIIVSKLSSTLSKNNTKEALWEFDNIIMSIYLLNYIDDVGIRQNVQKALNRIEAYHKLKNAVFHANGGKFRVKTEKEQQTWDECTRLVCSCIIYYNSYILSQLLLKNQKEKRHKAVAQIIKISPIAWRHINFLGRYEFNNMAAIKNFEAFYKFLDNIVILDNYSN